MSYQEEVERMAIYITPERVAKLRFYGIILKPEQILSQLFGVAATTDNWNRPTLTAEMNGRWVACLATHDAHFSDLHRVEANTPENAMADLILAIIKEVEAKKSMSGFRSRRPTDRYP